MKKLIDRLQKPNHPIDVVLDTDTFNEIDDQFALAYLLKSSSKLCTKAIYAAPFFNSHSKSPQDGMERSYQEIMNILSLMQRCEMKELVFKGSEQYLQDEKTPVISPAAQDLAMRAMQYTPDEPLYVVAIGAITNIASAILLAPEIINRIVLIWLGGNAHTWPNNEEFNLKQDVAAARIVFGCGVALVQLPCMGVVSSFTTCGPELEYWLRGKNKLCDYLVDATTAEANTYNANGCWSRAIWDVTAVAWLLDGNFMLDRLEASPIPQFDHHFSLDPTRHLIRYVYHINRDALFEDLFRTLAAL